MRSKAKIFGHPIHPMLVGFPIAFYTATLVGYIIYAVQGDPFWFRAAYAANIAGVVMALAAAIPGFVDWSMAIPGGTRAKKHGLQHMALNVASLLFFTVALWLNAGQWDVIVPVARYSIILPLFGLICTVGAGYLGWTLVQTHHVGVELAPELERLDEEYRKRAA